MIAGLPGNSGTFDLAIVSFVRDCAVQNRRDCEGFRAAAREEHGPTRRRAAPGSSGRDR